MRRRSAAKSHDCAKKMVERRAVLPGGIRPPAVRAMVVKHSLHKHVCPGSFVLVTDHEVTKNYDAKAGQVTVSSDFVTIVQAWLCPRLWSPFLAQRRFASVRSFTTFS